MMLKMQQKQRFFIYDRKEMIVLIFLGIMVAVFAFTLGVHLGKRVGPKETSDTSGYTSTVPTVEDPVPGVQEFTEQGQAVHQAADESLDQAAHDEVARTGLKMDGRKQVDLPRTPKSPNAGATTLKKAPKAEEPAAPAQTSATEAPKTAEVPPSEAPKAEPAAPAAAQPSAIELQAVPAALRPPTPGKFTLQVGSHQRLEDARDQANTLEALGLKPYLRAVDVKGKGKWFRLYVGGYPTKPAAEEAGNAYRSQHAIDSFLVANATE